MSEGRPAHEENVDVPDGRGRSGRGAPFYAGLQLPLRDGGRRSRVLDGRGPAPGRSCLRRGRRHRRGRGLPRRRGLDLPDQHLEAAALRPRVRMDAPAGRRILHERRRPAARGPQRGQEHAAHDAPAPGPPGPRAPGRTGQGRRPVHRPGGHDRRPGPFRALVSAALAGGPSGPGHVPGPAGRAAGLHGGRERPPRSRLGGVYQRLRDDAFRDLPVEVDEGRAPRSRRGRDLGPVHGERPGLRPVLPGRRGRDRSFL